MVKQLNMPVQIGYYHNTHIYQDTNVLMDVDVIRQVSPHAKETQKSPFYYPPEV